MLVLDVALKDQAGLNLTDDALDVRTVQLGLELLVALHQLEGLLAALSDRVARALHSECVLQELQLLFEGCLEDPLRHLSQRHLAISVVVRTLVDLHLVTFFRLLGLQLLIIDILDLACNELVDACVKLDDIGVAQPKLRLL